VPIGTSIGARSAVDLGLLLGHLDPLTCSELAINSRDAGGL
jgi:hypothetical protein